MNQILSGCVGLGALLATSLPLHAQIADTGMEFGFMSRTITVVLLNEGGKYVAVDLKHIAQGDSCRMDKDATIARVGAGATGMVRVRYAAAQISTGGCPFMTTFDLTEADYAAARAEFVAMKDEASKKVDGIKKDLGDKWDQVVGKKL